VKKSLAELALFQIAAAERRRLLGLGQIRIEPVPAGDTRALTRDVQAAASSYRQVEPDKR